LGSDGTDRLTIGTADQVQINQTLQHRIAGGVGVLLNDNRGNERGGFGTGLRIGEVLGIEIDKHISCDFLTLYIQQQVHRGRIEPRLKTANAVRQVDLHPAIAARLKHFIDRRKAGLLFCTRTGKPLSPTNIVRRHLHMALKELNYVNPHTGTHRAGNHAFRRFRNTYLRNYTECPEGLYKYWMGHAGRDMSDLYDKVKEDVEFRRKWAERCGFGFELPAVVPNVPKIAHKSLSPKAA
jgi:integrase